MDHRVTHNDSAITYYSTLPAALDAAKQMDGRRHVESRDAEGRWWSVETMAQLTFGQFPGDQSTLDDFKEAEFRDEQIARIAMRNAADRAKE